jgi:tetratricopeptide (TPR) repeat protein
LLARADLKEYAAWLTKAREGDREVKARLAEVDRWADAALDKWYGANRKREPHFAEALHAVHELDPNASAKLIELLGNLKQPAVARATAALELGNYAELGNGAHEALRKAVSDADPQVRTAAIRSLPRDASDATLSLLAPLLAAKEPRLVRTEAARAILRMNPAHLTGEERAAFHAALDECISGALSANDRAGAHLNVASMYEELGDLKGAEKACEAAIRVEPHSVGPRANLAFLYESMIQNAQQRATQRAQQGDRDGAEREIAAVAHLPDIVDRLRTEELALQERDLLLAPYNAGVQNRTGLIRHTVGWRKEAESALLNAALLEPRNPLFHYHLATLYRDTGRREQALAIVKRMLKLQPENQAFKQFAAELTQPVGPALPQSP